jgi:rRNA maturation endonuclease Nob1
MEKYVPVDYLCDKCEHVIYSDETFCPSCGHRVNWDKVTEIPIVV